MTVTADAPVTPVAGIADLAPVVDALRADSHRRATAIVSAARRDANEDLARAAGEATRILEQARADGVRAAERRGAGDLGAARRDAQAAVLAARHQVYLALRRRALERLSEQGGGEAGRRLGDLLETLARDAVGPSASVHRSGSGGLSVVATSGSRRAAIGPDELVDDALDVLADEVAALWT